MRLGLGLGLGLGLELELELGLELGLGLGLGLNFKVGFRFRFRVRGWVGQDRCDCARSSRRGAEGRSTKRTGKEDANVTLGKRVCEKGQTA